jgi:hypothetical protein
MSKTIAIMSLFLLSITTSFADDSVKVTVGTQTYLCEITTQLSCKATNQVQQQAIQLKKNAGSIHIEDKERNLKADIDTSLDHNNVVYDFTLCSAQTCSINSTTTNPAGNINQVMLGQYNITQKSFYIIGAFISTQAAEVNFEQKILSKIMAIAIH